MRRHVLRAMLLVGLATIANSVSAGDWEGFPSGREPLYRGSHLSPPAAVPYASPTTYGDTTYIGYSPGQAAAGNPWSIRASTTTPATNDVHRPPKAGCMWNWDPEEPTVTGYINDDSLQGWWPIRLPWRYLVNRMQPDYLDPSGSLDFGNLVNYYPVHGRTFGVVGVWHRDQGGDATGALTALTGQPSNGVTWVPLGGQQSAWCGLRGHGDVTAPVDGVTNNPFTADATMFNVHVRYSLPAATPKFPGYADQWDQLLYRDIDMSSNPTGNLTLTFKYATRMSTAPDFIGWFDRDPLTWLGGPNCAVGNFISSWDATGAIPVPIPGPVDVFKVYVGQPTESNLPPNTFQPFIGACGGTSGRLAVYDPLRRWFDEVIEANDPLKVTTLVSATGNDPNHFINVTIPNATLAPMLGTANRVRLVFRIKTNGQGSDVSTENYNSQGRGAAQVDDVTYSISGGLTNPAGWGDFEAANSIDNGQSALSAWRSTGKPPEVFTHIEKLGSAAAPYLDLCGSDPNVTGRICSMAGGVVTFGDHFPNEFIGEPQPFTGDHNCSNGLMSPEIQLCGPYTLSGKNAIGLAQYPGAGDGAANRDYMVDYELYAANATANSPPVGTGITYRWLMQCYPQLTGGNAAGANKPQWGNIVRSPANFQTDPVCFRSVSAYRGAEGSSLARGMIKYSPGAGTQATTAQFPDLMRIGWMEESTCYTDGVNACNPVSRLYIDNVSLVILDGPPLPIFAELWNWWQTAFPWNEGVTPTFAASFDTAGVLIRSGLDIGPRNGIYSFDVPGDTIVAVAPGTAPMRMDLIFRVLPGPGNYVICGNSQSGLAQNPGVGNPVNGGGRTPVIPAQNSPNFWATFLFNNGKYGTPSGHGAAWNPNVWNSARCDTAEMNVFPRDAGALSAIAWQATYHESELDPALFGADPYADGAYVRAGIGVPRHKCFLAINTAQMLDIDCEHDPPAAGVSPGSFDLSWVTDKPSGTASTNGSGYNGNPMTTEGTKIIPDGLLTPGAHVEYFWRKTEAITSGFANVTSPTAPIGQVNGTSMLPDTNRVVPQYGERNYDGHRFAGFGALPDRWKQAGYSHPLGLLTSTLLTGGHANYLVVNDQTSNGSDWLWWSTTADVVGASSDQKWGAEVGWHTVNATVDINLPANSIDRAGRLGFIAEHAGNPGTTWDGYQILGAESTTPAGSFGARYAHADAANSQINGKRQQGGPTLEHLKSFYKGIIWFSGHLDAALMGPQADRGSDDQALLKDWLVSGSPASLNRVFWAMGGGFVESNEKEADPSAQPDLDLNYLGTGIVNGNYRAESGLLIPYITLNPFGSNLDPTAYLARNMCSHTNDVLKIGIGAVQSLSSVFLNYQDPNTADAITYPSSILKVRSAAKPWWSLTEGFALEDLTSTRALPLPYSSRPLSSGVSAAALPDPHARARHMFYVAAQQLAAGPILVGTPLVPLDVPNLGDTPVFADFLNVRNNPMSNGMALIHFGLAKDCRVEIRVFDIAGREVRELADRKFVAGEHDVVWDGTDASGRTLARGVYFTQVKYRETGFAEARKLTILK